MRILVLGGSYFLGRVFVLQAMEHKDLDITLFNRGTYDMSSYAVQQIVGDRQEIEHIEFPAEEFDVVIDFCGYQKGDIKKVFHKIKNFKQYIFISTVDVYKRGMEALYKEDSPHQMEFLGGEVGTYIQGKVQLEQELVECCMKFHCGYTILRPGMIYGPFNYAPREQIFFQSMVKYHCIPMPEESTSTFQLVYVKDVAQAIIACIGNEQGKNQAFNLVGNEKLTYDILGRIYQNIAEEPCRIVPVEKDQLQYFPYPLYKEENHLCDNALSKQILKLEYTTIETGLKKTFNLTKELYME